MIFIVGIEPLVAELHDCAFILVDIVKSVAVKHRNHLVFFIFLVWVEQKNLAAGNFSSVFMICEWKQVVVLNLEVSQLVCV